MEIDLELYREEIFISEEPPVRLNVIEVTPEKPISTLVFVHGYGGYAMQWKHQLRAFADNYRVIAYDQRGHGRSSAPQTRYTMDEMVGDLHDLIDRLKVKRPFVLLGHSFGGAVATEYALRYPDEVERLVLVATAGQFRIFRLAELIFQLPLTITRPLRQFVRKQLSSPIYVLKHLYNNTMRVWNGWERFPQIKAPTLVIRGDKDDLFPSAQFENVAPAIPNAEEVNIGVSRHLVPLERAEAVNRAIERFIAGASPEPMWREDRRRTQLAAERVWLRSYETGVPYSLAFPERPLHHLLRSAARRHGSRPAITFNDRRISYRQLDQEVNRLANALRSLGVEKGTRVMLLLPNTPQFVIAFYAVLRAGGVVVSTSPVNEREEVQREVIDSQAEWLITLTLFHQTAREVHERTALRGVIFTNIADYLSVVDRLAFQVMHNRREEHELPDGLLKKEYSWTHLCRSHPTTPPTIDVPPESLALIQYTGGTTSVPKGVMLSHRALLANALQTRHWITNLREGREVLLAVLPFSHSYGMTAAMNVPIAIGAMMVILPSFNTPDVLKNIKRYQPTLFPGVPTMYLAINQAKNIRSFRIESIKACISGAAPLPVEVQEAFERLTRGRLVEGYGLTEASPVTHSNPLYGTRKVGSIGIPLPSTDARIVDLASGEPLPAGQIGELAVKGPQIMDGYWGMTEESEAVLTDDGWLLTGDIARMDQDGYFQIISRKKEMILAGKFQVYPRDVEEVLYEHPGVKEVAVVGLSVGNGDAQKVKAYVVPRPGTNLRPDELIALCKRRLQEYAVPWEIEFRQELPKSFVGKVLRRLLVEEE